MGAADRRPLPAESLRRAGRPYWLPPAGHGNGLDAAFWSQLAEVPQAMADPLLAELRRAGIPGWAAPARGLREPHPDDPLAPYDVWVQTGKLGPAEDVAMGYLSRAQQAAAGPGGTEERVTLRPQGPRHRLSARRTRLRRP